MTGSLEINLSKRIQERLVFDLLDRYPLPWSIDFDWTVEIHSSKGIVIKLQSEAEAKELIAVAEKLDREMKEAIKLVMEEDNVSA